MECKNSNGYFKDPVTFEDLSAAMPRVVECSIDGTGKFIWPQVKFSDGSQGKIVYKYFTEEEKDTYKKYRLLGKDKQALRQEAVKVSEPVHVSTVNSDGESKVVHTFKVSTSSVVSGTTLDYIRRCDKSMGVWQWDGVLYDLLSEAGGNKYIPVARSLIPMSERQRLNLGGSV